MRCLLLVALFASALALTDEEQWTAFKAEFGKTYSGIGANEAYRFSVFQSNLRTAEQLQKANPEAVFGVTKFSDLTPAEFSAMHGMNLTSMRAWTHRLPFARMPHHRALGSADWVKGGRVTDVKDQSQCGSCWAFSATAAAEACNPQIGNPLVSLSAQQVAFCCTAGGSSGCNGGWPDQCLNWALGQNLYTWDSVPYNYNKASCPTTGVVGLKAKSCQYHKITQKEDQIRAALEKNPVSIALDATPLQSYKSGLISGATCSKSSIDHAVLLVADDGSTLTVKNSWGKNWGESGYFRMQGGVNCLHYADEASSQVQ